jgi:TolB protein
MDADGKNPRRLTNHPADDFDPAWSPDDQKIAFVSNRDGNCEIYVMDSDGKNPRNLTNKPADDWGPEWSPDGKRIAFNSERDGNREIYVMDADGKDPRNLTNHPAGDYIDAWFDPAVGRSISPAGKRPTVWGEIKRK